MDWFEKLMDLTESAESLEVRIYRNRIREELLDTLTRRREEMRGRGRYPYQGEWLTTEEITLLRESERKEKLSRLVQTVLVLIVLLLSNFGLIFFIWKSIR